MTETSEGGLELRAAPARQQDIGTGTARLPRRAFGILGIAEGEPVRVDGERARLWTRALPAHAEDEYIDIARIDATVGECVEVGHGGPVRIHRATTRAARQVDIVASDCPDASGRA